MYDIESKEDLKFILKHSKNKVIEEDLMFYYELDQDLSKYIVKGDVTFTEPVKDINFIPSTIDGQLCFFSDTSFAKLTKDAHVGSLQVGTYEDCDKGLTTLKGLNKFYILEDWYEQNTCPYVFNLLISKKFKDTSIEMFNIETINFLKENRLIEIFSSESAHLKKLFKLLPENLVTEGANLIYGIMTVDKDHLRSMALSYAYLHMEDHVGETLLGWI